MYSNAVTTLFFTNSLHFHKSKLDISHVSECTLDQGITVISLSQIDGFSVIIIFFIY
ncbi:hypothetical protein HOF65_05475 [bacterium]|nr:hypothetical protein [bacterium]MBT4633137.1 hypothetical protein [bacterium]